MCGIAGIISKKRDLSSAIKKINDLQSHRGPDGSDILIDEYVALGHVRLSIIDLSDAGSQPMKFDHLVLTYNGELYNFKEIQNQLIAKGYSFTSKSDSEVMLKAWHCWGEKCLNKFYGMFAFSIFDTQSKQLYLCRDSYGVKPVFYTSIDNEFIFSSELRPILSTLRNPPEPDRDAISTYLALQFLTGTATGFRNIHKLEPGTLLTVNCRGGEPKILDSIFWGTPFSPKHGSKLAPIDSIDDALQQSIEAQLVSDVPVGAFLSGGVDSSLICHYAAKLSKDQLHTFSVGFIDGGDEHDETAYAKLAASTVNSVHHPIQIELESINDRIKDGLAATTDLNADTSVFLTDVVCEEAKKYVTVCLSGAGGDELFAGYYRHQALKALKYLDLLPDFAISAFTSMLSPFPQHRDGSIGNFCRRVQQFLNIHNQGGNFVSMLRNDAQFVQNSKFLSESKASSLDEALMFDFRYFLSDNIFSFTDKISMKHSLEVRVPFMDPRVINVAESLHIDQLVTLREKKIALKQLAARYFHKDIIYRPKQGFSAPLDIWMRTLPLAELESICLDGIASRYIPESTIHELATGFVDKKLDYSTQLYSLIVLNHWGESLVNH